MKCHAYFAVVLLMLACHKQPAIAPATPETIWIDIATHSDTIITNVNDTYPVLYYASKDWQVAASSFAHGYRTIAARFGDSILVKPVDDTTTNYDGPFLLKINQANDSMAAQNFLITTPPNAARMFVRLR